MCAYGDEMVSSKAPGFCDRILTSSIEKEKEKMTEVVLETTTS